MTVKSETATIEAPPATAGEHRFDWPVCHEAEKLLLSRIGDFLACNRFAQQLAERMLSETGTLLLDWTDYLVLPPQDEGALRAAGFVEDPLGETARGELALHHPEAMLPRVLVTRSPSIRNGSVTLWRRTA